MFVICSSFPRQLHLASMSPASCRHRCAPPMASACLGLSDLPDDLFRRVLYFAPAREGASTAVLSRHWRSLWRTSGAVNLDSRLYRHLLRRPEEVARRSSSSPATWSQRSLPTPLQHEHDIGGRIEAHHAYHLALQPGGPWR